MKKLILVREEERDRVIIDPSDFGMDIVDKRVTSDVLCLFRRTEGEFAHKAFFLSSDVDWVVGKDSSGTTVLVPLKKK